MAVNVLIMGFLQDEANILKRYLGVSGDVNVHNEICSVDIGMTLIKYQHPDLIFLDIDTLGKNTCNVTKAIKEISDSIRLVYVATHSVHSTDVLESNVYDYIQKPVRVEHLSEIMVQLSKDLKAESLPIIPVWKNDRFIILKPDHIIYLYTTGKKTMIKSKDGEYTSLNSLFSFEKKLACSSFYRTHKSYLVNLEYIKEIVPWFNHTYNLVLDRYEKDEVPVSRTYLKDFKKRMGID